MALKKQGGRGRKKKREQEKARAAKDAAGAALDGPGGRRARSDRKRE